MSWSDGPNKRFLDVKEAAEYLGLATSTVCTMVSQRRIPFVKMGRRTKFDREKLDLWQVTNWAFAVSRKLTLDELPALRVRDVSTEE